LNNPHTKKTRIPCPTRAVGQGMCVFCSCCIKFLTQASLQQTDLQEFFFFLKKYIFPALGFVCTFSFIFVCANHFEVSFTPRHETFRHTPLSPLGGI
jgi:hypothetical protein